MPIATPPGWTTSADGRTLLPPHGHAGILFTPSTPFTGTAEAWMGEAWSDVLREFKLVSGPIPGTEGGFLTRIGLLQQADGTTVWVSLNTILRDDRGEGVILFAADEETFRAHLPALSAILQQVPAPPAVVDGPAPDTPPVTNNPPVTAPATPPRDSKPPLPVPANTAPGLDDYVFTPPSGWQVQRQADQIILTERPDQSGCLIQMLPPQPSSGDLEGDASAVFDLMYAGWQPKQHAREKYVLSTGRLPLGLEFCLLEAPMERTLPDGRYDTEDGAALVVRLGDRVALLAVRHRSTFGHAEGCLRQYTTWNRFFNSFTVRGASLPERREPAPGERIVGRWAMRESGAAAAEYVFAANGNYAFSGALGSSHSTSDIRYEYLHLATYAFTGDGSYAITGNELTLTRRETGGVERLQIRFEKINRAGAGWTDRMSVLRQLPSGPNEVRYERQNHDSP